MNINARGDSRGHSARKSLAGAASGLTPTGAGDRNGLAPAVFEAVGPYMKSGSAVVIEFVFLPRLMVGGSTHLLDKIFIAAALSRILGESPWDKADLCQVCGAKFRRGRFDACGRERGCLSMNPVNARTT